MMHVECGNFKMVILHFRTGDNFLQSQMIVQKLNFPELMTTQKTPTENGNLKMAVLLSATEDNFIEILMVIYYTLPYEGKETTQKTYVENGNSAKTLSRTV